MQSSNHPMPENMPLATSNNPIDILKERIKSLHFDVNQPFLFLNAATPCYIAAEHGNASLVKALLEKGANPNLKFNGEWTPLLVAAERGHSEVVKELLDNPRINPTEQVLRNGNTPIHVACGSLYHRRSSGDPISDWTHGIPLQAPHVNVLAEFRKSDFVFRCNEEKHSLFSLACDAAHRDSNKQTHESMALLLNHVDIHHSEFEKNLLQLYLIMSVKLRVKRFERSNTYTHPYMQLGDLLFRLKETKDEKYDLMHAVGKLLSGFFNMQGGGNELIHACKIDRLLSTKPVSNAILKQIILNIHQGSLDLDSGLTFSKRYELPTLLTKIALQTGPVEVMQTQMLSSVSTWPMFNMDRIAQVASENDPEEDLAELAELEKINISSSPTPSS